MKDANGKTVYFTMTEDVTETAATAATEITSSAELEEIYSTYHTRRDSNASEYSMLADSNASEYSMIADVAMVTGVENTNAPDAEHTALVAKEYPPFAVDSGATVHLSPVEADFYTLETITLQKIWGVNGKFIEAKGKGDIHVRQSDGTTFILKDALYVPQAALHLLSVRRITDTDHTAVFTSTELFIVNTNDNSIVTTATRCDKKLSH
jgi:hypothetical protein